MFTDLKIENLRGIVNTELNDLKRFNLLVGKNNSGKSTILDAIFLIIGPTNAELVLRINNFRGINLINELMWKVLFHDLDLDSKITISAKRESPSESRTIIIEPAIKEKYAVASSVVNETFSKSVSPFSEKVNGLKIKYSLINKNQIQPQDFQMSIFMKNKELEIQASKEYEENLRGICLSPNNVLSDLLSRFHKVQISKEKDEIVQLVKVIEPNITDLVIGSDGFIYCDVNMKNLLPLNVMGDGIIKILAVILAIYDAKDGIVLIDEIENGLHFSAQSHLWKAIYLSAIKFNVQLFSTTHSIECVKAFVDSAEDNNVTNDINLFRIEREYENIKSVQLNHELIKTSLESGWEIR